LRKSISVISGSFPWLTIGVCSILLLPALFMDGMFSDGMLYASVSKNFAQGYGTFWEPYSSATSNAFHEQPPLMFFLQGLFFKLLGYGLYTERIYCLLAALINVFLIYRCWKIIRPASSISWLPVLFWFTMPVTFYAFLNNLEECTMSVFVLAAMVHLLRALYTNQRETMHLLLAGAMILLAGLTKGVQGMFLLAGPFLWWLCVRNTGFLSMIKQSFFVAIIPLLFVMYAWFTPEVRASFASYFSSRFGSTFNHMHDTSESRFHMLYELLLDSLPMLVMMLVLLIVTKSKIALFAGWQQHKKLLLFFLAVAASGILPLMVTLEQRGFYLVTALPYFAIVASLFVAPQVELLQENLARRKTASVFLSIFGMIMTTGALIATFMLAGKPKRDAEKVHDLPLIAAQTGERITILTTTSIYMDWGFHSYAMRNHGISITENKTVANEWLVVEKTDAIPEGYTPIPLPTERYNLYKKAP
jgi:4-amino-4-deoxy-L-arabinose transferase-like glycosyltransferase